MIKRTSLLVVAAVVGLAPIVPITAFAQPKDALSIGNDDSVFIDAKIVQDRARQRRGATSRR